MNRLVTINGAVMHPNYRIFEDEIYNLEVHDSDIWVTSFPKSGTTWAQEMVWQIANDINFEEGQKPITVRYGYLELTAILDRNFKVVKEKHIQNSVDYIKNLKQPRFIKSHLPFYLLPQQLQMNEKKPKIIYVVRNPKDACVSYYNHYKLLFAYKGSFEEYFELFLNDKVLYAPYWDNISSYWERRNQNNILIIKYEDMKNDLKTVVNNVAQFLNKSLNDTQMTQLIDHLSFEKMKNNPAVNYEDLVSVLKDNNLYDGTNKFMRSGTVGSHKLDMTEEMVERMDKWIEKNICEGYTI